VDDAAAAESLCLRGEALVTVLPHAELGRHRAREVNQKQSAPVGFKVLNESAQVPAGGSNVSCHSDRLGRISVNDGIQRTEALLRVNNAQHRKSVLCRHCAVRASVGDQLLKGSEGIAE
jgi:hypothetical protein